MTDSIERFVADLALAETGELFNQYADEVPGLEGDGLATCEGFGAQADVMRMTASPAAAIAPASVSPGG